MPVISISVIESSDQIISGIPKSVTISANTPATIYYTLDGSDPTLFSSIYISPIFLPYDQLVVNLKIFASNGVSTSTIITETYSTDKVDGNLRMAHSPTTAPVNENIPNPYPFGTPPCEPQGTYLNPGDAGVTVDNPSLPSFPNGFNSDGYGAAFTNAPYNSENYQIVYSTTNAAGQTGAGIGTLPAGVIVQKSIPASEQTQQFSSTFDPRAMVIFQDFSKENPNDPSTLNRQFFSLNDPDVDRDGAFHMGGGSGIPPSGSFVRSEYNPRTNEMTSYYRDSWSNRWIISKAPFSPGPDPITSYTPVASAFGGRVFEWIFHQRRVLF